MSTLVNPLSKQSLGSILPTPTSIPADDDPASYEGTWIKSASSSRRASLAAPPGIAHPLQTTSNYEIPMPKLTRAASVSFLPHLSNDNLSDTAYLRHLANATSQYQGASGSPKWNKDIWGAGERSRTPSWAGQSDPKFSGQPDYVPTYSESYHPPRRMSLNPLLSQTSGRSRTPSYSGNYGFTGSRHQVVENDTYRGEPHSLGSRGINNYSRRESMTSPPLATHSGSSSDSLGGSSAGNRFSRRFSLAPQFGIDLDYEDQLSSQMDNLVMENYASILGRRHSVAASAFPVRHQSPPTPAEPEPQIKQLSTHRENYEEQPTQFKMDMYDNKRSSSRDRRPESYFVIEFKGGRTDCFYIPIDSKIRVAVGDLVIVEADRGQDLGKVIQDQLSPAELSKIQQEQRAKATDTPRSLEPKKIYRHAQPNEVSQLVTKCQDEANALQLCLSKLRQHNLPMEVVDAEYQWDRRKLTFFYIAEDRIDFRELVRELFKVYKTRIWMCAVPK